MHRSFAVPESGIPIAEIVSALSFALDLTEDAVPGHALRTCLLGLRLGHALGLDETACSDLFYALLLKDVGCSNNAARLCQVMGSDERKVKNAVKFEDWTRPSWSGARTAWRNLHPAASPARRFLHLLDLGLKQQSNNHEMITLRCHRGGDIVARIGLSQATSTAVRHLDEHWDGSGYPDQLTGDRIPLLSRIMLVAQHLDVFGAERGHSAALSSLEDRSGRWFDPDLVRTAQMLHGAGLLWSHMDEDSCRAAVLDLEPGQKLLATNAQVDQICYAFADVVDVKSAYTASHSRGVADAAVLMADALDYSPERRRFISHAALLHDLGKLRVPNSILDKPGKLTVEEFAVIREHPGLTHRILSRVSHFAHLATIAGQHHERLDGSGYPNGLTAAELTQDARLIAVADVYSALVEDRPYRAGVSRAEVRRILDKETESRLDRTCYDALLFSLDQLEEATAACALSA